MSLKKRLDIRILEENPQFSRAQIQSWIMQGKIMVDGQIVTKPGTLLKEESTITYDLHEPKYVSRAGFKLEAALDHFGIEVKDYVILDAGISTGGFTDCLLQRGALRIYGVDVGYGQVHEKIRQDTRVVLLERTNLKELPPLPDTIDMVTLDLSFISVLKVMAAVTSVLKPGGTLLVLIKPQFEALREQVGKGGIIKDARIHQEVIERVTREIQKEGYQCKGVIPSPIQGTMGNQEFLALFVKGKES